MDGAGGYSGNGEDGLGGAARNPQNQVANKRLQQTQAKVDELRKQAVLAKAPVTFNCFDIFTLPAWVVGIMRVNVEKVLERDQKLSELDNRADALQQGASQFEQQAGKLKRKYWWKNLKMMIIMGVIGVIILIIIIVWASSAVSSEDDSSGSHVTSPPVTAQTGSR